MHKTFKTFQDGMKELFQLSFSLKQALDGESEPTFSEISKRAVDNVLNAVAGRIPVFRVDTGQNPSLMYETSGSVGFWALLVREKTSYNDDDVWSFQVDWKTEENADSTLALALYDAGWAFHENDHTIEQRREAVAKRKEAESKPRANYSPAQKEAIDVGEKYRLDEEDYNRPISGKASGTLLRLLLPPSKLFNDED